MRIRPETSLSIKAELHNMHAKSLKTDIAENRDLSRYRSLRGSQLPFCPLKLVLTAATEGKNSVRGFHANFFTRVGTTVHELVQEFQGAGGTLLANWKCPICGKFRKLSHDHMCPCGAVSKYHEVEIKHKLLVGHVDAIFRAKDGRYWVVDYKTCSVEKGPLKEKNPGRDYREQVEAYAVLLKEIYGLDIAGVAVFFLTRDNPTKPFIWAKELFEKDFPVIRRRLETYHYNHGVAYNAKTIDDLKWVWKNRLCQPFDADTAGFCPFTSGCSTNKPAEAISWFKHGLRIGNLPVKLLAEPSSMMKLPSRRK